MVEVISRRLAKGDWVEVRSPAEIEATLDAEGRLDGMPFMPEMLAHCGQRLQVFRRANKTCVEGYGLRRMRDTVLLDEARCDGAAHDGCQRNCLIFWKEAWLRPVSGPADAPPVAGAPSADDAAAAQRLMRLPVRDGETYLCQSPALAEATLPLSKWDIRHLVEDLRHGELSPLGFARIVARTLFNRVRQSVGLPEIGAFAGEARGAPKVMLGLKRGDRVRVRPEGDIRATLGPNGKAAGLSFEPEMGRYMGGTFEVDFRVERIILEETGRMVELKDTVALKGLTCLGTCVRNCPRANTLYWREAWLERAAPGPAPRRVRRAGDPGREDGRPVPQRRTGEGGADQARAGRRPG